METEKPRSIPFDFSTQSSIPSHFDARWSWKSPAMDSTQSRSGSDIWSPWRSGGLGCARVTRGTQPSIAEALLTLRNASLQPETITSKAEDLDLSTPTATSATPHARRQPQRL